MVRDLSRQLAARIASEVGVDVEMQVVHLFELAIGRKPSQEQRTALLQTYSRLEEAWKENKSKDPSPLANLCHAVMNSAAFLYVD